MAAQPQSVAVAEASSVQVVQAPFVQQPGSYPEAKVYEGAIIMDPVVAQRGPQYATVVSQHQSAVLPSDHAPQQLLPYPGAKSWAKDMFDPLVCCACCTPPCFMAYIFPCWPMAHIAEKLKILGNPIGVSFNNVVVGYVMLLVLDAIIMGVSGLDFNPHIIFIMVLLYKARVEARGKLNLPGGACSDLCCSIWCMPCAMLQLEHQMWANPNQVPGCDCSEHPAHLP